MDDTATITLSGIARLARVQRPVVSMWRTRMVDSDVPFPAPYASIAGRERFDADAVAAWLEETEHGNNPEARLDAQAHALLDTIDPDDTERVAELGAFIALQASVEDRIDLLDAADLVERADEVDPDDRALLSEVEAAGARAPELARQATAMVDASFSAAAALRTLESVAPRPGPRVSADVRHLVAELLLGLTESARAAGTAAVASGVETAHGADAGAAFFDGGVHGPTAVLSDPCGTAALLAASVAAEMPEGEDQIVVTRDLDVAQLRSARRHLLAADVGSVLVDGTDGSIREVVGSRPVVLHLVVVTDHDRVKGIEEAEALAGGMGPGERAIVLGSARSLVDAGADAALDRVRSQMLRSGSIRASVRLPRGVDSRQPRQAGALWLLTPPATAPLGQRRMLVGDLSKHSLDRAVRADLVSDLVASLGDARTVRSHAFRFLRPVVTSSVLARSGSLAEAQRDVAHIPSAPAGHTDLAVELDAVLQRTDLECGGLRESLQPQAGTMLRPAEIGTLMADRHLRYIGGTRVAPDLLPGSGATGSSTVSPPADRAAAGIPVITAETIRRGRIGDAPRVDRLVFVAQHPSASLTEPGDVVFVTGAPIRAVVDHDGGSAVAYPARILRINPRDPAGLLPQLIADDLSGAAHREWRRVRLRRVVNEQRRPVAAALERLRAEKSALLDKLATLDRASRLVADGAARGHIVLADAPRGTAQASTAHDPDRPVPD